MDKSIKAQIVMTRALLHLINSDTHRRLPYNFNHEETSSQTPVLYLLRNVIWLVSYQILESYREPSASLGVIADINHVIWAVSKEYDVVESSNVRENRNSEYFWCFTM